MLGSQGGAQGVPAMGSRPGRSGSPPMGSLGIPWDPAQGGPGTPKGTRKRKHTKTLSPQTEKLEFRSSKIILPHMAIQAVLTRQNYTSSFRHNKSETLPPREVGNPRNPLAARAPWGPKAAQWGPKKGPKKGAIFIDGPSMNSLMDVH